MFVSCRAQFEEYCSCTVELSAPMILIQPKCAAMAASGSSSPPGIWAPSGEFPGPPRVCVAVDSFKDCADAAGVSSTVRGVITDWGWDVETIPMSDGGEGFVDAARRCGTPPLLEQQPSSSEPDETDVDTEYSIRRRWRDLVLTTELVGHVLGEPIIGPTGTPLVEAPRVIIDDEAGVAVIEMASVAGLQLVPLTARNPRHTTSYGVGQVIRYILHVETVVCMIYVGMGGSATVDCGLGAMQALGGVLVSVCASSSSSSSPSSSSCRADFHQTDACAECVCVDAEVPITGGDLAQIHSLRLPLTLPPHLSRLAAGRVQLVMCADVRNPLCGPTGSAVVYGPQKGLCHADGSVDEFDRALGRVAGMLQSALHWTETYTGNGQQQQQLLQLQDTPGAGAAGGFAVPFIALGAYYDHQRTPSTEKSWNAPSKQLQQLPVVRMCSGVEVMADLVGLQEALCAADLVIAGEGCYDAQTAYGKVVSHIIHSCREARAPPRHPLPVVVLCGRQEGATHTRYQQQQQDREGPHAIITLLEVARTPHESMTDPQSCIQRALHKYRPILTKFVAISRGTDD